MWLIYRESWEKYSLCAKKLSLTYIFFQLWVTGGESSDTYSNSSKQSIEIVDENGSHSSGSKLSWNFHKHCSIKLNQTHVILTGGSPYPSKTLIINLNNSEMTRGPDFEVSKRDSHACSRLSHPNGTNYIIVAGGYSDLDILKSTEMLDVNNIRRGWYEGKIPTS